MLDTIIRALQVSKTETLIGALITFILVWLYKEIRNNLIDSEKAYTDRINKAIEAYGELSIEICNYLKTENNINDLDSKLTKAFQYLPKSMMEKFIEWKKTPSNELLTKILHSLEKEMVRVKSMQKDPITINHTCSTITSVELFFNKMKSNTFTQPILFLIVIFITFIFISIFIDLFLHSELLRRIYIIAMGFNLFCYFIFYLLFTDVLSERRFINSIRNWIMLVLLVILPAALLLTNKWYLAVLGTFSFWIYMIFILPKSLKKVYDEI